MVKLIDEKTYFLDGKPVEGGYDRLKNMGFSEEEISNSHKGAIAYKIIQNHNKSGGDKCRLRFDALASHDITYVGVIQTAKASGLEKFPLPYVLTNCHNSLCAVGGTINEDDHLFGLSAAKKYGGIYVPPHIAVIHQYMRECMTKCGDMILGSDSHTRYGSLGTMGIGEGGPEIVKQLLNKTYDINMPKTVAVYLTGKIRKGVGPQDVALSIIGQTFKNGFVKNCVMEFFGDGVYPLSVEFRSGIDVMTTETACLSSIWVTDDKVKEYYKVTGREGCFKYLQPDRLASYDRAIIVDLGSIEPMAAMPFHPSNTYKLSDVIENPYDVLSEVEKNARENEGINVKLTDKIKGGRFYVEQGIIAGCAGGMYENIMEAASILDGKSVGSGSFALSVYPASQTIYLETIKNGGAARLMSAGAVLKTAFCGPCFGAGDVPANNSVSIRHTTRNFPNREGSRPSDNQMAYVILMDSRSIAATAANGGALTSAMRTEYEAELPQFNFDGSIYQKRVYNGFDNPQDEELRYGPNIADWPQMFPLNDNVMLKIASAIYDPVTTTDELIPSGETSSYRSNPLKLAEFTLSRKDPKYVGEAKQIRNEEESRREGKPLGAGFTAAFDAAGGYDKLIGSTSIGSAVYAVKPGDGSAREQAASCQRVLGGLANIASEYATKRYRSNLINWGMLPLTSQHKDFKKGDYIFLENIRQIIKSGADSFPAVLIRDDKKTEIKLSLGELTETEKEIILKGSLINYYKN
jgi:aconitate hydratase